ncbi:MAG: flavin monoamine oxidase family protein [Planctomycetota bacterium]
MELSGRDAVDDAATKPTELSITRRTALVTIAATTTLGLNACSAPPLQPIQGRFLPTQMTVGHRLRDSAPPVVAESDWSELDVVIVGGGIAGLSAARRLLHAGCEKFQILEIEDVAGGTSRAGTTAGFAHPWAAHYLPVPQAHQHELIDLLTEMQVVESIDEHGEPRVAEEFLVREPQERLFLQGEWHDELDPLLDAPPHERAEWQRALDEFQVWHAWRDAQGRAAFRLPLRLASDDPLVTKLDEISFAEWLDQRRIHSPKVRWMAEYACRDDYGTTLEQTSAWAGLFYFVSRMSDDRSGHQSLITWPAGNGAVVQHLVQRVGPRLQTGVAVAALRSLDPVSAGRNGCELVTLRFADGKSQGIRARRVIWAAPRFIAARVVQDDGFAAWSRWREFEYGSWVVANLQLRQRPRERSFPLAWDNVLYDSESLGYVTATHQLGIDHGPTIWTYYYPLCGANSTTERRQLLDSTWEEWVDRILDDLERAHPDLRPLVERIDVLRWGHAMIRPRPGFMWGVARREAARPWNAIHFAHTELSGLALLEEAFDHGCRAADEVLAALSAFPGR